MAFVFKRRRQCVLTPLCDGERGSEAMIQAAVGGPVARRALAPRAAAVLVAGARYEAVHGWRTRLFHAYAVASAGKYNTNKDLKLKIYI